MLKIGQKLFKESLNPTDVFIGFTDETVASLVYRICKERFESAMISDSYESSWFECIDKVKLAVKQLLIQSSTSDGIIRLLMQQQKSPSQEDIVGINFVVNTYYGEQSHDHFAAFFHANCFREEFKHPFIQITTHSKLINSKDVKALRLESAGKLSGGGKLHVRDVSLLSFDTQQQFVQRLQEFFDDVSMQGGGENRHLMIVQCECGHFFHELIACARFTIIDEYEKYVKKSASVHMGLFHVVFIIQIPKISGGCLNGFQTSKW